MDKELKGKKVISQSAALLFSGEKQYKKSLREILLSPTGSLEEALHLNYLKLLGNMEMKIPVQKVMAASSNGSAAKKNKHKAKERKVSPVGDIDVTKEVPTVSDDLLITKSDMTVRGEEIRGKKEDVEAGAVMEQMPSCQESSPVDESFVVLDEEEEAAIAEGFEMIEMEDSPRPGEKTRDDDSSLSPLMPAAGEIVEGEGKIFTSKDLLNNYFARK